MNEYEYIPQIIFSGSIRAGKPSRRNITKSVWIVDADEIKQQANCFARIIETLDQEEGIIHAWFQVDDMIKLRDFMKIETQLEKVIQSEFGSGWQVEVILVPVNEETDLETILEEVEHHIHKVSVRYPFEQFAQIVGFGDAILAQAVTLEGIKQFEDRYTSIYWHNQQAVVNQIRIHKNFEDWRKQFRDFVIDHDYQAAFEMLKDLEDTKVTRVLRLLLKMMIKRLNFDFDEALSLLQKTESVLSKHKTFKETQYILESLQSTNIKERDLARIVELYRHLELYFEKDDFSSFLVRFYRAREAVLYYLLQHGQNVSYPMRLGKHPSIYEVIEQLEEKYEMNAIDQYYGTYFYLKSKNVADTLQVRNNSFIGHGRKEINHKELLSSHFGTARTTTSKAKRRFIMDSTLMLRDLGVTLDNNLENINRLLLSISRQFKLKGTKKNEKSSHLSVE